MAAYKETVLDVKLIHGNSPLFTIAKIGHNIKAAKEKYYK